MALSCECDWHEYYTWCSFASVCRLEKMPKFKRRKRCAECGCLIDHNATDVGILDRARPRTEWEIDRGIYGNAEEDSHVGLANWYFCEECMDLYESVGAAGFCIEYPGEHGKGNLREDVREYARDNDLFMEV